MKTNHHKEKHSRVLRVENPMAIMPEEKVDAKAVETKMIFDGGEGRVVCFNVDEFFEFSMLNYPDFNGPEVDSVFCQMIEEY